MACPAQLPVTRTGECARANITTAPQSTDLRTAVHWRYSRIDSLDYTIEWQIAGPLGARPFAAMTKYGTCDN